MADLFGFADRGLVLPHSSVGRTVLVPLNDAMGELFGRFYFQFFEFASDLYRVKGGGVVDEVVAVLPATAFAQLEGHFLGEAVPVVDVAAGVDTTQGEVRTDLQTAKRVDAVVGLDCAFGEEPVVFEVVFDVDAGDRPEIASL